MQVVGDVHRHGHVERAEEEEEREGQRQQTEQRTVPRDDPESGGRPVCAAARARVARAAVCAGVAYVARVAFVAVCARMAGGRGDEAVADGQHGEAGGVDRDHPHRAHPGDEQTGQRRTHDRRRLAEGPEQRVRGQVVPLRQQLGHEREPTGRPPRVQQRGHRQQGDEETGVQHPDEVCGRDRAQRGRPYRGVPARELSPAPPAQPATEQHRTGRPRQRVRRHRQRGPGAALPLRGELQCQPRHREQGQPVTERGSREARQQPAQHGMAEHRPVGEEQRGGHGYTRPHARPPEQRSCLRAEADRERRNLSARREWNTLSTVLEEPATRSAQPAIVRCDEPDTTV